MKLSTRSRAGQSGRTSGPEKSGLARNRPTIRSPRPAASSSFRRARPSVSFLISCGASLGVTRTSGGALAVITGHDVGHISTVRIFNCPTKTVLVNRRLRKRVCVDGMVALVRGLAFPAGTVAHLEVDGTRSAFGAQTGFVQGAA